MIGSVHDFTESLRLSEQQADAPWLEVVYRKAFPDFACMHSVRQDGWAQRGGIDRVITLESGKTITVDEKVRAKNYPDILLEYWSNAERKVRGWVAKPLACDFIAYAFVPSQTCYLLPALALRRAWREHVRHWVETCRKVEAHNQTYTTVSVAVPIDDVLLAIQAAQIVSWASFGGGPGHAPDPEQLALGVGR